MQKDPSNKQKEQERKTYSPPEIIHELELETRAGSIQPDGSFSDPQGLTGITEVN